MFFCWGVRCGVVRSTDVDPGEAWIQRPTEADHPVLSVSSNPLRPWPPALATGDFDAGFKFRSLQMTTQNGGQLIGGTKALFAVDDSHVRRNDQRGRQ